MDLTALLAHMVNKRASDLFISVGAPPTIKIEGHATPISNELVTPQQAQQLIYSIMDDEQSKCFESTMELNMGLNLPNVGRFRINIYRQRSEPALVARYIKGEVPSISALGLPNKLQELILEERGLILVVGGTGTGKSTTLASMIDYRSQQRTGHILTVEDPIEFIHQHKTSLVNQREVGLDTLSYTNALKNALREAPDVIMIGEIRDLDTMKHAIAYAETGHLCIATLHANSASQAMERILNFFPETAHKQVLMDLSLHLKAIVSQRLAHGINGSRVAAVEIMMNTPFVADLIKKGNLEKIKDAMQQSKQQGSQIFDDALYELHQASRISEQEALRLADSRNNLSLKLRLEKREQSGAPRGQKELTFDRRAEFNAFKSFKLSAMKVDNSRREDIEQVMSTAIAQALINKGYAPNENAADINVQFVLGLKASKGLTLEPIRNEISPLLTAPADTDEEVTCIINVVDNVNNKPIWRMTASRKISGPIKTQDEVNAEIEYLMAEYPDCQ